MFHSYKTQNTHISGLFVFLCLVFSFYHSLHCLYLVFFDYSIFNYQMFCISSFFIYMSLLVNLRQINAGMKYVVKICIKIGIWFALHLKR